MANIKQVVWESEWHRSPKYGGDECYVYVFDDDSIECYIGEEYVELDYIEEENIWQQSAEDEQEEATR